MSYFQKHLKTMSSENNDPFTKNNISQSQCAYKFKKNPQNKSKVAEGHTVEETLRANRKTEHDDPALVEFNPKQVKPTRREEQKPAAKARGEKHAPVQFATQNPHCQSDSMSRELQTLMMDADNSMQQLLNSSINQFTRYLEDKDNFKDNFYEQHTQLIQQNNYLRASLDELKNILKSKLESALLKQKEELTVMMEDYIKLITKLLKDKEDLTVGLEKIEHELKQAANRNYQLEREVKEGKIRGEELTREKDDHINKTKKQIDQFLMIIEQYDEQAENQGKASEEMKARIQELEQQLKKYQQNDEYSNQSLNHKLATQNNKIQTLIELLQRSQEENKQLRQSLSKINQSDDRLSQLEKEYCQRLEELQKEHEEEFMEYETAVRETINKKDECIQRLNSIIDGYRSKRCNLESSMETTGREKLI